MRYGYAWVSSNTQDFQTQVEALKAAGCERIYNEKVSRKNAKDRPEFAKLMRKLLPGDIIVVTKLDRLARSSRHLRKILHDLKDKDCAFLCLGEAWCATTCDVGRLMTVIIAGIAEFERSLIRQRCDDAIKRAEAKGTKFGTT